MTESKCGITCLECGEKDKMGCGLCANILNPFFGSYAAKTCCESKSLEGCGVCTHFPCEALIESAYDKEQKDKEKLIRRFESRLRS